MGRPSLRLGSLVSTPSVGVVRPKLRYSSPTSRVSCKEPLQSSVGASALRTSWWSSSKHQYIRVYHWSAQQPKKNPGNRAVPTREYCGASLECLPPETFAKSPWRIHPQMFQPRLPQRISGGPTCPQRFAAIWMGMFEASLVTTAVLGACQALEADRGCESERGCFSWPHSADALSELWRCIHLCVCRNILCVCGLWPFWTCVTC